MQKLLCAVAICCCAWMTVLFVAGCRSAEPMYVNTNGEDIGAAAVLLAVDPGYADALFTLPYGTPPATWFDFFDRLHQQLNESRTDKETSVGMILRGHLRFSSDDPFPDLEGGLNGRPLTEVLDAAMKAGHLRVSYHNGLFFFEDQDHIKQKPQTVAPGEDPFVGIEKETVKE